MQVRNKRNLKKNSLYIFAIQFGLSCHIPIIIHIINPPINLGLDMMYKRISKFRCGDIENINPIQLYIDVYKTLIQSTHNERPQQENVEFLLLGPRTKLSI